MAKKKDIAFVCTECGAEYSKWQGQCGECKAWNTVQEFRPAKATAGARRQGFAGALSEVKTLSDVDLAEMPRLNTGIGEFDRVLGGGLVAGSAILIGGHPGAGKSTLLLQTLCALAQKHSVLYVTGEESLQQIAMRAQRLNLPTDRVQVMAETNVAAILDQAEALNPDILVVDSIQVVHHPDIESAPGSVSQVRESAAMLTQYAKRQQTALFLIGHVTKDGSLAGPKVLEHMIDCSVMLESAHDSRFRTLRSIKNRFGAVNELGVFAMLEQGLKEVTNPSSIFLNRQAEASPGSLVTVLWEGTRPLLVELQALVDDSPGGYPKRVTLGLDQNRLAMMLAVLHRHGGIFTGDQDVYLNVVGGVKINETSADLASLLAILSSLRNRAWPKSLCVFGEVGLSGEVRPVPSGQERVTEAAKHGFTHAVVPRANAPRKPVEGLTVLGVSSLQEALDQVTSLLE
ncbi:DNA repair protein RadA [Natronospirillum operosum]|uniref:DNA repair protein RadA n=1 Tax=Natronospirillum operosum TaxID=2759953 RepID=A0A4Z0WB31_9GAMM|nr:DNA repair protein RadA [Natronospirillum operosum]TGG91276.1 DNA repair protein RadA [Natronospirillum operosum]